MASWTYNDIDGDTESTNWIVLWYKNGILQISLNDSVTISSSLTSKNENWHFTLQVYDGNTHSVLYTSTNVSILNTAPSASNIGITSNPKTSEDLTASWTFYDLDSDDDARGHENRLSIRKNKGSNPFWALSPLFVLDSQIFHLKKGDRLLFFHRA